MSQQLLQTELMSLSLRDLRFPRRYWLRRNRLALVPGECQADIHRKSTVADLLR